MKCAEGQKKIQKSGLLLWSASLLQKKKPRLIVLFKSRPFWRTAIALNQCSSTNRRTFTFLIIVKIKHKANNQNPPSQSTEKVIDPHVFLNVYEQVDMSRSYWEVMWFRSLWLVKMSGIRWNCVIKNIQIRNRAQFMLYIILYCWYFSSVMKKAPSEMHKAPKSTFLPSSANSLTLYSTLECTADF